LWEAGSEQNFLDILPWWSSFFSTNSDSRSKKNLILYFPQVKRRKNVYYWSIITATGDFQAYVFSCRVTAVTPPLAKFTGIYSNMMDWWRSVFQIQFVCCKHNYINYSKDRIHLIHTDLVQFTTGGCEEGPFGVFESNSHHGLVVLPVLHSGCHIVLHHLL